MSRGILTSATCWPVYPISIGRSEESRANLRLDDSAMQELPKEPRAPLVSLAALCAAVSHERLGAYSLVSDKDSTDAVARYLWNGALCISFHPSLHALEVTFRNNLFRASEAFVSTAGRTMGPFGCWLDVTPSFLLPLELNAVQAAKLRIGKNPRHHTPGRLVAKLGFGFWTALCQGPYGHGRVNGPRLWPSLLPKVFPSMPKSMRSREVASARLDAIREFRNRIAHHEPIWDHDLLVRYDEILEALGWMQPSMSKAVRVCGDLELIYHNGPEQFRTLAARLLGAT